MLKNSYRIIYIVCIIHDFHKLDSCHLEHVNSTIWQYMMKSKAKNNHEFQPYSIYKSHLNNMI